MHPPLPLDNNQPQPAVRRLTKLLVSVTIQGSTGPVQVITSPENTVGDLIRVVLEVYEKEKRRPLLSVNHPDCFELHYSPFSLQSLKMEEKLINLGSRNFFLCRKPISASFGATGLKNIDESPFSLFNFKPMDFLLQIIRSLYFFVTKA